MSTKKVYEQDGEEAQEIAKYLPYFPFKGSIAMIVASFLMRLATWDVLPPGAAHISAMISFGLGSRACATKILGIFCSIIFPTKQS